MSAPADDAPRIGNRYRLDQRIGAGAMGAVWRGTDELLNRTVAVKELLGAAEPPTTAGEEALEESRQRLMREGRIGARLQHPHVISMFDVVVHDDRPWLVMEYLPSQSLAAMLTEKGPLEPRVVAEIGRQVADGLAAAHAAGVVHRDVKPGNVLIAEDGRVKLTDFGVSRAVDDVQLTRTGLIAGTPAFLSPEVARGKEPTAGSDVFALGATLYAAVEGRPPFGLDENAYALLHKVATGTVDPPHQAGPLTALLMRLLSDDPTRRPTASEARDELAGIAEGRAPAGGTPSTGTALLDMSPVAAAAAGRTAVADPSPEQVATAAALPPASPRRSGLRTPVAAAGTTARRPIAAARS
jgi:serine/threonine protein kinase